MPLISPQVSPAESESRFPGANDPSAKSAGLNRSTAGQWEFFASHRQRVHQLLLENLPPSSPFLLRGIRRRICVLGAGNCNDLDLAAIVRHVDELHLLDIDATALESAVLRQKVAGDQRVVCHAPMDLTTPCSWASGLGKFDLVLSSCVLSQLIAGLRDRLGAEHPELAARRLASIEDHFRLMRELLSPEGHGIFVTDIVSSDTVRSLRQIPTADLPGIMRTLIAEDKTFRGLDPASVGRTVLKLIPGASLRWQPPWLWHLSALRSYLVWGMVFGSRARRA